MSFKSVLEKMGRLESGEVEELTVVTEKNSMLLRNVSPGYFIILMMGPGGSLGKGRYELKKASYELAPEFL